MRKTSIEIIGFLETAKDCVIQQVIKEFLETAKACVIQQAIDKLNKDE